jgi:ferredoxin/flavodoxin---NADP+ reductase
MSGLDFCSAKLIDRKDVSARLAVFRFRSTERLSFAAGQYLTLGVPCNGELVERPYSIVSSPHESCLEFFIELVPNGLLTPMLWSMKLGTEIQIRRRVVGQFTLDRSINRHLMIATVTGVAPFISMLRTHQLDNQFGAGVREQFLLIHGASRSEDFGPYYHELKEISNERWLTYVPTISRPWEEANWRGETGRVEDIIRKHADRLVFNNNNSVAYLCGHPHMIENVKTILSRARFSDHQIRQEHYFSLSDSEFIDGHEESVSTGTISDPRIKDSLRGFKNRYTA